MRNSQSLRLPFDDGQVIRLLKDAKNKPLSPLMVKTLRAAYEKQKNHEPLGQIDLDGSFTALLKRA